MSRRKLLDDGITVFKRKLPSGKTSWQGRWLDPATGKRKSVSLDRLKITNDEGRRAWVLDKREQLGEERRRLHHGRRKPSFTTPTDAREAYVARLEKGGEHRPATIEGYKHSAAAFVSWAGSHGTRHVEDLQPHHLVELRDHITTMRKQVSAKKGRRGERKASKAPISKASQNHLIGEIKAFLNHIRKRGLTPHLSKDEISERLAPVRAGRPKPKPLKPAACKKLLEAALRHDAARPRHPVAPMIATFLLTGMRRGEVAALKWEDVDLEAPDDYGNPTGTIELESTATKTHAHRTIDLLVSPGLKAVLAAWKLRAARGPYVFGGKAPVSADQLKADVGRLQRTYGAPAFSLQRLRQTCASYLVNAPGIFKKATIYRSAAQLGHSPTIADRNYLKVIRGIPEAARTLEAAMKIEDVLAKVARGPVGEAKAAAG